MHDSGDVARSALDKRTRQMQRPCWGADLVVYNLDRFALKCEPCDRTDKVRSMLAEQPGRSGNNCTGDSERSVFGEELGTPIRICWTSDIILGISIDGITRKDIVGGDSHQLGANPLRCFGNMGGARLIHEPGSRFLCFRIVHSCPGSTVDDDGRPHMVHQLPHRIGVGNVELRTIHTYRVTPRSSGDAHDIHPQLTSSAGYQDASCRDAGRELNIGRYRQFNRATGIHHGVQYGMRPGLQSLGIRESTRHDYSTCTSNNAGRPYRHD